MNSLLAYIFSKAYFFYIFLLNDEEFAEYYGAGVLAFIFNMTLYVVLKYIFYFIDPNLINTYSPYYLFFSTLCLLFFCWYYGFKKKYRNVINIFNGMTNGKKKMLAFVSISYLIIIVFATFKIGNLVREFNFP
jgi:hypothetical protein